MCLNSHYRNTDHLIFTCEDVLCHCKIIIMKFRKLLFIVTGADTKYRRDTLFFCLLRPWNGKRVRNVAKRETRQCINPDNIIMHRKYFKYLCFRHLQKWSSESHKKSTMNQRNVVDYDIFSVQWNWKFFHEVAKRSWNHIENFIIDGVYEF